jgi:hypothetical protein
MEWVYVAHDREQWKAFVNTVMKLYIGLYLVLIHNRMHSIKIINGDENSDSVKYWEILEKLSCWGLYKRDSAFWS